MDTDVLKYHFLSAWLTYIFVLTEFSAEPDLTLEKTEQIKGNTQQISEIRNPLPTELTLPRVGIVKI